MAPVTLAELASAKSLSKPYSLFADSFICEFIEPPASLDATVLIRATYVNPKKNALNKIGKAHPQRPPLHIHFDQTETFMVASGKVWTTETYGAKDRLWTKEDGVHVVEPWAPHTFWPCADVDEDTTIYLWAHPDNVPEPMDKLFFENLLCYISDTYEANTMPNIFQIMVLQHASATAMVMFPTAWWLGPLRWWVPWQFQKAIATVGKWMGYRALMEKYTPKEDWENYVHTKRA